MKRTKKEFTNYNDYYDRPFGLKWGTAFALSELTQVINSTKNDALKTIVELPIMSREEMDDVLQIAFLKSLKVEIQLSIRDENDRLLDSLTGSFSGMADADNVFINDIPIAWEHIRNIRIL
ncbi:hypothetical protein G7062_00155 [Erysipelothrix sp. HDW6C]|uniref:hypothetical protein n=1 Tax=Erysipelothrix sp. HDW6C TaxID=2714930 RepID=UPI00140D02AE|nr:hypothetical protein [Erysipelothrix sp. HDW6C]QIK68787.1 hypothetical protein G7062_00155 [Erysipelothrix sp. HDW6C]